MKKFISLAIVFLFGAFLLAGCGSKQGAPAGEKQAAGKKQYISIGTAKVGGTWYPLGAGIAEVLNKNVPGLQATAEETNGAVANVQLINDGQAEVGFTMPSTAYESYTGTGNFQGKKNHVLAWFSIEDVYQTTIVPKGSGIKTALDIKGKRIGIGQPGSANFIDGKLWLEASGVSLNDVKILYLSQAEMAEALKNGQIDVFLWCTGYPSASIQELALSRDVEFLSTTKEAMAKIQKQYPYYSLKTIPAGIYKGIDKDLPTMSYRRMVVIRDDLDEETVYKMTKAVFENLNYLGTVHPIFKALSLNNALDSVSIPLHPGALKYYKEKGVPGLDDFVARTNNIPRAK
ncbi:MAG: TAXI family TRAP transporter solute-binding subunit [Bacillota bacterium]